MGWAGRRSLESAVYGTEDCSRCVVCPTKVSPVTFTPGFFVRPQSTRREGSDVSVTHVFACLAERRSFLEPHFLGGYLTSPDQLEHQLGSLRRMSKARRGACESWVGGIGEPGTEYGVPFTCISCHDVTHLVEVSAQRPTLVGARERRGEER
eukprot:662749-Rhodomonas_salina.1